MYLLLHEPLTFESKPVGNIFASVSQKFLIVPILTQMFFSSFFDLEIKNFKVRSITETVFDHLFLEPDAIGQAISQILTTNFRIQKQFWKESSSLS